MLRAAAILCLTVLPAEACETALVLSVDVSGSIDEGDYLLQIGGIASALSDPEVVEALVEDQVALAVVQWSGVDGQAVVIDWQRMLTADQVADFADRAAHLSRAVQGSSTAVGEGLRFAMAQFAAVPDCRRKVVDISGDGQENAGFSDAKARAEAIEAGIIVNALAIEDAGAGAPITAYYRRWVITPGGFVFTARGLMDYPRTLRLKLLRELTKPIG